MIPIKITELKIEPQTHVRTTKGDRWLLAVTDEYLTGYDSKRSVDHPQGKPGRNLNRKRQIEKYFAYKDELRYIARKLGFTPPTGYFAIWFYVPHPKSWRRRRVAELLYRPHQSTPDCDNMIKAYLDGVMPRKSKTKGETGCDDRKVHCYAAFKVWVLPGEGGIKVVEYDRDEFTACFQHGFPHYGS